MKTTVPLRSRSAFWPMVGETLVVAGYVLEGSVTLQAGLAMLLVGWGVFLGGTARREPAAVRKKIADLEAEAVGDPGPWRTRPEVRDR